jgi:DNA-binding PadR family transcriptional regulator
MGFRGRGGSRARRGDVRAAVLALLAEEPMHGYEMIKEIESRSGGVWKPSAGSIYPTLQLLEDEGLIAGEEVGGKRRFTLTDEGRAAAEERGERSAEPPWEEVRSGTPPEVHRLAHSMRQLNEAIAQSLKAGSEQQQARVRDLLDETRRKIYAILSEADA